MSSRRVLIRAYSDPRSSTTIIRGAHSTRHRRVCYSGLRAIANNSRGVSHLTLITAPFQPRRRYAPLRSPAIPLRARSPVEEIYDVFMRARNELFAFSSIEVFDTRQSKLVPPRPSPPLFRVLPPLPPRPGYPTSWGYNEPSTIQWPSYMTPGDDTLNLI